MEKIQVLVIIIVMKVVERICVEVLQKMIAFNVVIALIDIMNIICKDLIQILSV